MADLKRTFHWERFAPNFGDNLELPEAERISLDLATGLSTLDLAAFHGALEKVQKLAPPQAVVTLEGEAPPTLEVVIERVIRPRAMLLAEAWAPFVRLVGQHSVNGKPLAGLGDYLFFALSQAGIYNVFEILKAVDRLNTLGGTKELFSDAASGGSSSTEGRKTAPVA